MKRKKLVTIILTLLIVVIVYAHALEEKRITTTSRTLAQNLCEQYCKEKLNESQYFLTVGPCLLNPIGYGDWVCDVAHNPRLPVDDLPENQCSAYREGKARHFVEVDEKCGLIRAV